MYQEMDQENPPEPRPRRASLTAEESSPLENEHNVMSNMRSENFPESIYGAAMSFIIQATQSSHWPVFALTFLVGLALALNVFVQLYALYCVKVYIVAPAVAETRSLYDDFHSRAFVHGEFDKASFDRWDRDKRERLCSLPFSHPDFAIMILFIWTMVLLIEVKETVLFSIWWFQLPDCEHKAGGPSKAFSLRQSIHLSRLDGDESGSLVVRAASRRVRAFVFGTIMTPKFVIAVLLWWLGARWLVSTTRASDLILNCMALAFIVELDEMTFLAIVPHRARKTLELFLIQVPPPKGDSAKKVYKWTAQMAGKLLLMFLVPLVYMRYFQTVLPGYRFDVNGPCEAWRLER